MILIGLAGVLESLLSLVVLLHETVLVEGLVESFAGILVLAVGLECLEAVDGLSPNREVV